MSKMFNISKKIILLALTLIVIFTIERSSVSAQISSSLPDQSAPVDLSFSPTNPRAGDSVVLELTSFGVNLDTSKITWYVDGVATKEGTGIKNLSVKIKSTGGATIIRVVIETTDGLTTEVTQEISSAGVDMIIEPTSFIPAFYQGKPLFVNQGVVRVVAIPDIIVDGKKANSKNLTFRWQKDDTVLQSQSGVGRDSVIINGSVPIRDINISIEIIDSSGKTIAQTSKILSAGQPQALFYENNPLYGILFNKAIANSYYLGDREELKIVAKPYFFNTKTDNSTDLDYKWSVNGSPVTTEGKTNELLLRQTGQNLKGTASISLGVNNLVRIFQSTTEGFNVTFGQ